MKYENNFVKPNKSDYLKFFNDRSIPNPIALTLTSKQFSNGSPLDKDKITRDIRYFMNRLNQKVYGKAYLRFKKCLFVIPIIEGNEYIRLHTHMVIERPRHLSSEEFENLIRENWSKTVYGYNNIKFKPSYSYTGWVDYMLKHKSKGEGLQDSVDWENVQLPKLILQE